MKSEEEKLKHCLRELSVAHVKFTKFGEDILNANNQTWYVVDSLAVAVINRAIQLIDGYVTLANANNYIAAIPFIRLQLDNALRFFAIILVDNPNDFFTHFMDGKPVNNYKSHTGQNMSDNYLAKELDAVHPGVLKLYKETCDYVHLSMQHVHASKCMDKGKLTIKVTNADNPFEVFSIEAKYNFAFNMIQMSRLVLIVLNRWKRIKDNFPQLDRANTPTVKF
ncbi:MAG: hypothetical protein WC615_18380 [Mucilaginibacter sp.]|jgi:hypothetical protein|uniref:hypothetical protein n=1 Tax=Mucilaginibacter sp. TaxID=1882438 RepID=UPI0035671067